MTERLENHSEWPDEDCPGNILFGDFFHGASSLVPSIIQDADTDLPKYSHEGKTTIFGPRDELTPAMFNDIAETAEREESWCSDMADYQSAERYNALKRGFEDLAIDVGRIRGERE